MRVLQVDIVVPVRNEEHDLAPSIRRLVGYLRESFPFSARITIADNGSTDATGAIAARLARELPEVRAVHMEQPGRGRALRAIWSQTDAEVLAYMDVDLSTDLNALLPLVAPLLSGHSDLAIGTSRVDIIATALADLRGMARLGVGLGGSTAVSSALIKLLEQDASSYKWVAATEGSTAAAPLELTTGDPVMSIGGFNGTDPWPTPAVFKQLVASHEIHYYVGQGSQSFGGGSGSSAIASWVASHFTKETVGGQTVYDLTKPLS